MRGVNRSILAGRLTKDPEVRYTDKELAITRFCLAINRGSKSKGTDTADFINCVAFGGLAKICGEYLKKGKLVAVEGRLQIRSYESRGQKRTATEVIIDDMQMLDNKFYSAAEAEKAKEETELVEI
jgi:single-strand DNA-binding protein